MAAEDYPIIVLLSGNGSNLQAIIDAIHTGQLHARILAVISNRADAYGLERARKAGIPAIAIPHNRFPKREAFEQALIDHIDGYEPRLVVLAGFMRILTTRFVHHYHGRLINIHPSLLPNFTGLDTHRRALDAGVTEHGASIHFVTDELDGGPVISQARVAVRNDDNSEQLAARVLQQEHRLFPQTIEWFSQGRLRLDDSRVLFDGKPLNTPIDCTDLT